MMKNPQNDFRQNAEDHTLNPQKVISNEDIISAARRLRDKQNASQNMRPWRPRYHAGWYVGIPAACLVGFAIGFYLRPSVEVDAPHQALVRTEVRVDTVVVQQMVYDTIYQTTAPHRPVRPRSITANPQPTSVPKNKEKTPEKIGVSMLEDGIRYDKLASRRGIQMY